MLLKSLEIYYDIDLKNNGSDQNDIGNIELKKNIIDQKFPTDFIINLELLRDNKVGFLNKHIDYNNIINAYKLLRPKNTRDFVKYMINNIYTKDRENVYDYKPNQAPTPKTKSSFDSSSSSSSSGSIVSIDIPMINYPNTPHHQRVQQTLNAALQAQQRLNQANAAVLYAQQQLQQQWAALVARQRAAALLPQPPVHPQLQLVQRVQHLQLRLQQHRLLAQQLNAQLLQSQQAHAASLANAAALQVQLVQSQQAHAAANQANALLNGQIAVLQARIGADQITINGLQQQIVALQAQSAADQATINGLQAQALLDQAQLVALNAQIGQLQATVAALNLQIGALQLQSAAEQNTING